MPIALRAATSGVIAQALSRGVRQHTKTHRPPARSDLRKGLKAEAGWRKNITPKRENNKIRVRGKLCFGGIGIAAGKVRQTLERAAGASNIQHRFRDVGAKEPRARAQRRTELTFPSTMMETGPGLDRARTNTSFCEARSPPGSETLNSGTANNGSRFASSGSLDSANAAETSGGNPSADSQACASVRAEYPVRQCFAGSASNAC
jgi:hypothetical protein